MKAFAIIAIAGIAALCIHHEPETDEVASQAAALSIEGERAMALFEHGRLGEAKNAFISQRMELTRLLGPEDPATLKSRNNLASVFYAMGDYAGAETMHRTVLALREKTLGFLHQDSLASRHNLAVTLLSEGKYEEALLNARLVETGRRHVLGRKSPERKEASRLREFIQESMDSRQKEGAPRTSPSGFSSSPVGTA